MAGTDKVRARLERVLGRKPASLRPLSGGCVGQVYRAGFAQGPDVVVKVDDGPDPKLSVEGMMLRYLREHSALPVPGVLHSGDGLLVMEFVEGSSSFDDGAERHAAELLADLHGRTAEGCGFEQDTLIGGLDQPNPWTGSWVGFFAEHRLVYMAAEAERAGRLPGRLRGRVERLAGELGRWLDEPGRPSLLHGDVWSGNVLASGGRITGMLDPAVYYGHPEVELAFITLFNCFGRVFFERYSELRPIGDGFFETRRDVYNLYPLLVHVRLFGGGYVGSVEATLSRLGY